MVELGSFNNFYKAAFSLNLVFHSPQVSLTRVFHLSIWCFNLVHSLNLSFCFRYAFSIDGVIKVTCYIWSSQTQSSYVKEKTIVKFPSKWVTCMAMILRMKRSQSVGEASVHEPSCLQICFCSRIQICSSLISAFFNVVRAHGALKK